MLVSEELSGKGGHDDKALGLNPDKITESLLTFSMFLNNSVHHSLPSNAKIDTDICKFLVHTGFQQILCIFMRKV